MNVESLRKFCLTFPNATENLQWGDALCFKIGGKLFVTLTLDVGSRPRICLKCDPETFAELIEREGIAPAPYVGRYKWVGLDALDTLPNRELQGLIGRSYELVVEKLPKNTIAKKAFAKNAFAEKAKKRKPPSPRKKSQ